jgi:hypothetical protein
VSRLEASKIAGHSDLEMTGEYTCASSERQNELTRRIQRRLSRGGWEEWKTENLGVTGFDIRSAECLVRSGRHLVPDRNRSVENHRRPNLAIKRPPSQRFFSQRYMSGIETTRNLKNTDRMPKKERTTRKRPRQPHDKLSKTLLSEIDQQTSVVNSPIHQKLDVAPMIKEPYAFDISTSDVARMTGCSSGESDLVAHWLLDGTLNVMAHGAKERDLSKLLPVLKTLLLNSRPRTPVEAMLLTQMMTAQEMASRLAVKALHADDAEASASYSNRAERFMNLFTRQAECLQKLKGLSGQQKVVVEHLNVIEGGKAVVGQVINKREDGHEGR